MPRRTDVRPARQAGPVSWAGPPADRRPARSRASNQE